MVEYLRFLVRMILSRVICFINKKPREVKHLLKFGYTLTKNQ